jgi:hypothetical protein
MPCAPSELKNRLMLGKGKCHTMQWLVLLQPSMNCQSWGILHMFRMLHHHRRRAATPPWRCQSPRLGWCALLTAAASRCWCRAWQCLGRGCQCHRPASHAPWRLRSAHNKIEVQAKQGGLLIRFIEQEALHHMCLLSQRDGSAQQLVLASIWQHNVRLQ